MPKTKPNQPCPCGSDIKYKKCCMSKDYAVKAAQEEKERELLDKFMQEKALIDTNPRISQLRQDLPEGESTKIYNITALATSSNFNQICSLYSGKGYIVVERNASTEAVFNNKKAKYEDFMVIKQNHYLCFDYQKEYKEALTEIRKWN